MAKEHKYLTKITWTGNTGKGTESYRGYKRNHEIAVKDKKIIEASSDPAFMGDEEKHNPEELFLSSLSSCHMLWYLHLCANAGINVSAYSDEATGIMVEDESGNGRFTEVILRPYVTINDDLKITAAAQLHSEANKKCFIANSCNFPVRHIPVINVVSRYPSEDHSSST